MISVFKILIFFCYQDSITHTFPDAYVELRNASLEIYSVVNGIIRFITDANEYKNNIKCLPRIVYGLRVDGSRYIMLL